MLVLLEHNSVNPLKLNPKYKYTFELFSPFFKSSKHFFYILHIYVP